MNNLPTYNTPDITLLPRPYSEGVDIESDNPNMLNVARDVKSINPNTMIFQDTGRSMLDEGGLVYTFSFLIVFVISIPLFYDVLLEPSFLGHFSSIGFILLAFVLPVVML